MTDDSPTGSAQEAEHAPLIRGREGLFRQEALAHRFDDGADLADSTPLSSPWLRWSTTVLAGISLLLGATLICVDVPQSIRGTGIVWEQPIPAGTAPRSGAGSARPRLAAAFPSRHEGAPRVGQVLRIAPATGSGENETLELAISAVSEPFPSPVAVAEELGPHVLRALSDTGPAIIVFTEPFEPSALKLAPDRDEPGSLTVPVTISLPPEPLVRVLYSTVGGMS